MALTPTSSHGGGIPQGGPLTSDLAAGGKKLTGLPEIDSTGAFLLRSGGNIQLLDSQNQFIALQGASIDAVLAAGSFFTVEDHLGRNLIQAGDDGSVLFVKLSAAPPDADFNISTFGFWLTDTIGATTVRIKATDSAGTYVNQIVEQASPITSGALPTLTITSGTGRQVLVARAAETVTPFTGDGTNNAATCAIALSPDDVTYSTLATISIAAALNLTGVLTDNVSVRVPAGWYIKLTATHGTLGTTTYY